MFFPDKIKLIKSIDRVLEIGPGADPHPRSDVFLELEMDSETDYHKQFGHERKLETTKQVVFYDGVTFPFKDKEFDYIICSHVLEHVPDVNRFLSEIFRVGKRGYFEYPLITYEYLFNFGVHLNYLKFDGKKLYYESKANTPLDKFALIQEFLRATLTTGYTQYFQKIPLYFFEGFEWETPFEAVHTSDLGHFVPDATQLPVLNIDLAKEYTAKALLQALARKVNR